MCLVFWWGLLGPKVSRLLEDSGIYIFVYIPRTSMTSIFEGQPSKRRRSIIKTRVIWVPGIYPFPTTVACVFVQVYKFPYKTLKFCSTLSTQNGSFTKNEKKVLQKKHIIFELVYIGFCQNPSNSGN